MDHVSNGYGWAILAKEIAHGRVVTVAVESMNFIKPISVGDVVCCYGQCLKVGRSSIKIKVEVWVKKVASEPIGETLLRDRGRIYLCGCWERWQSSRYSTRGNLELERALASIEELQLNC